jgi:tRNA-specific 2-thiouridylase
LARLGQNHLATALLPLGALTKEQTRRIAHHKGLIPTSSQESQDICFIKGGTYGDFISRQSGFKHQVGPIEDIHGQVLGQHHGLHRFTIGQRRGINCPAAHPYYVIRIEPQRNCVVVGTKEHLCADVCKVHHINWIGTAPANAFHASVQVRYRHRAVPATVTPLDETTARVTFNQAESALTPGQGAVFYQKDEVLGGGWIA